jgi:UDPglucose 6-dehydrogenase
MTVQKVAIIGSGYVGLVSGVCLAAKGHKVVCVDANETIVRQVKAGNPHIYENGLAELLLQVLKSGNFNITTDLTQAMVDVDGVLIAVGTPTTDGKIDLTYVKQAASAIGGVLQGMDRPIPVIIKSTVLPGVTDTLVRRVVEESSGKKHGQFGLGMNPEFLREGDAISDFMYPDRIVLGCEDEYARSFLNALYAPWDCEKLFVNSRTAELVKYANNFLLAMQISAINEIANIAYAAGGIDIMDVVQGVHLDKRWNPVIDGQRAKPGILTYLVPGCGYGGSCFPKDVQALRAYGVDMGVITVMLDAVISTNDRQPEQVQSILIDSLGDLKGATILVLGLAFKPETDDVREAPSLKILSTLADSGATILAHDPQAVENFRKALMGRAAVIRYVVDWTQHVCEADIVVLITPWPEYTKLSDFDLKGKIVFDARRTFCPEALKGARYLAIGRADLTAI